MSEFATWFEKIVGKAPHAWQDELGSDPQFGSRLIRIPTGFGKTLGVLLAWAYHRIHLRDETWPRRLAWCLPMRVLVEQTEEEVRRILGDLGVLWNEASLHQEKVGVHLLMGGANAGEWHLYPEECAVLIGTQDMLLSRALNRGYGAARARWPMDFGLLNQDCLWVLDEVQLMDVGLATSAQLEVFRAGAAAARPTGSFWMSATLQPSWLDTRDTREAFRELPRTVIPPGMRTGPLWDEVAKPCTLLSDCAKPGVLAKRVVDEHERAEFGKNGPTVVVVNTVDRAIEVAKALRGHALLNKRKTEVRLVHSRFRPAERAGFREAFLNRTACQLGVDRIIVSTQVIEAGVDISARVLFTDIAPWPSLVQRFGRAARWGGTANIFVVDTAPKDEKAALPYTREEIDSARTALEGLKDVAPLSLERFEEVLAPEQLGQLYPYEPNVLLLKHELDELFDTTPDLTGSDIDISRFIRSGDERDLQVFWADIPDKDAPDRLLRPNREALCSVPFQKARDWLCGKGRTLSTKRSAWVWSFLDGAWRQAEARNLYPGQTVLVDSAHGGYDWDPVAGWGLGWLPSKKERVSVVALGTPAAGEEADSAQDDEALSATPYRTIGTHGMETGALAEAIVVRVSPIWASSLALAGRLHDIGKAHAAFQACMQAPDRPNRSDLAKAPDAAWLKPRAMYRMPEGPRRAGFRHELASALALFAVLARHDPDHPALLGTWKELLQELGESSKPLEVPAAAPTAIERSVLALSADDFDLVAYLVASHHGKVRASLHATPADQVTTLESGNVTIRGLCTGDELPTIPFGAEPGDVFSRTIIDLSPATMGLSPRTGASWADRVLGLVARLGPFQLAWLEALLRAADQRASRLTTPDPALVEEAS